jgi:hypothetical protein
VGPELPPLKEFKVFRKIELKFFIFAQGE